MRGKTDNQMQLIVLDIDSMVSQTHLFRQIKHCVNLFEFIYEKAAPYYSHTGRKSIDTVIMTKMQEITKRSLKNNIILKHVKSKKKHYL